MRSKNLTSFQSGAVRIEEGSLIERDLKELKELIRSELKLLPHFPLPEEINLPPIPYKGIPYFEEKDAKILFGRSEQIMDLLEYVEDSEY